MTSFADDYRVALAAHDRHRSEESLADAYELGRRAVVDGLSLLELVALHEEASRAIAHDDESRAVAARFLMESLGTFDMIERGYWESRQRAKTERDRADALGALADAHLAVVARKGVAARKAEIERWARRLTDASTVLIHEDDAEPRSPTDEFVTMQPIVDLRGSATGDLIATKPVAFTDGEQRTLRQLSLLAGVVLDDARRFEREHEIAVTLQKDLLPTDLPTFPGLDIAVRYVPAGIGSQVGGDWYDVFELGSGQAGFVVGDVMGHGIHGASLMIALRIGLRAVALDQAVPSRALERVDRLLEQLEDVRLTTVLFASLDLRTNELTVANAGHPPPLLIDRHGRADYLVEGRSIPLGMDPAARRPDAEPVRLAPTSSLLLFTDGLTDAIERRGDDGLAAAREVADGFEGTADELCARMLTELCPGDPDDDVCLLAVTLRPS